MVVDIACLLYVSYHRSASRASAHLTDVVPHGQIFAMQITTVPLHHCICGRGNQAYSVCEWQYLPRGDLPSPPLCSAQSYTPSQDMHTRITAMLDWQQETHNTAGYPLYTHCPTPPPNPRGGSSSRAALPWAHVTEYGSPVSPARPITARSQHASCGWVKLPRGGG